MSDTENKVSISEQLKGSFDKISGLADQLGSTALTMQNMQLSLLSREIYIGYGEEDINLFLDLYTKHMISLASLYGKLAQAGNVIVDTFSETDKKIAKNLVE